MIKQAFRDMSLVKKLNIKDRGFVFLWTQFFSLKKSFKLNFALWELGKIFSYQSSGES
jgi:hypothetical protein